MENSEPLTDPAKLALPVPAIICICIGAYIVLIIIILIIRQALLQKGMCAHGQCCGKEGDPCCECCIACSENLNCCRSPNLEACLDSCCPARKHCCWSCANSCQACCEICVRPEDCQCVIHCDDEKCICECFGCTITTKSCISQCCKSCKAPKCCQHATCFYCDPDIPLCCGCVRPDPNNLFCCCCTGTILDRHAPISCLCPATTMNSISEKIANVKCCCECTGINCSCVMCDDCITCCRLNCWEFQQCCKSCNQNLCLGCCPDRDWQWLRTVCFAPFKLIWNTLTAMCDLFVLSCKTIKSSCANCCMLCQDRSRSCFHHCLSNCDHFLYDISIIPNRGKCVCGRKFVRFCCTFMELNCFLAISTNETLTPELTCKVPLCCRFDPDPPEPTVTAVRTQPGNSAGLEVCIDPSEAASPRSPKRMRIGNLNSVTPTDKNLSKDLPISHSTPTVSQVQFKQPEVTQSDPDLKTRDSPIYVKSAVQKSDSYNNLYGLPDEPTSTSSNEASLIEAISGFSKLGCSDTDSSTQGIVSTDLDISSRSMLNFSANNKTSNTPMAGKVHGQHQEIPTREWTALIS